MGETIRNNMVVGMVRAIVVGIFFVFGCVSLLWTQYVGNFLFQRWPENRQAVINLTKKRFIAMLVYVTWIISPTKMSITYDEGSLPESDSFRVDSGGHLLASLTPNSVIIGNHQIYTDWLFLWFISYSSRLGDCIFIMLKDLSKIPILGTGMKNFNFLFLSRKWDKDKVILTNQLLTIDADARGLGPGCGVKHVVSANVSSTSQDIKHWPQGKVSSKIWPYHVILYPEGTVASPHTRARSDKYCEQKGRPKLKHTLLPRVRGLYLTLRKLRSTVEVVYDVTCGYSDLKPDEFGEDVFTLKKFYLRGIGPKTVNYYIKAWRLIDIPLGKETDDIDESNQEDLDKFEKWLFDLWYEKDFLMSQFYKYGSFVDPKSAASNSVEKVKKHTVVADVKVKSIFEVLSSYTTILLVFLVLRIVWMLFLRS